LSRRNISRVVFEFRSSGTWNCVAPHHVCHPPRAPRFGN
jgi:hypothetical protein